MQPVLNGWRIALFKYERNEFSRPQALLSGLLLQLLLQCSCSPGLDASTRYNAPLASNRASNTDKPTLISHLFSELLLERSQVLWQRAIRKSGRKS
jgi:hypothetical protein